VYILLLSKFTPLWLLLLYVLANSNLDSLLKLIEKLSVKKPSGQTKLKILKEIAKEHQIDWDTTESEQELLKPPEELIVRTEALFSLYILLFYCMADFF
jgi:hypothetical protein